MSALAVYGESSWRYDDQENEQTGQRRRPIRTLPGEWPADRLDEASHVVAVPSWYAHARCADAGDRCVDTFDGDGTNRARAVCRVCPVRKACLDHALEWERGDVSHAWGVRGGLTPIERCRLWERRQRGEQDSEDALVARVRHVPRERTVDDWDDDVPRAKRTFVSQLPERSDELEGLWGALADVNDEMRRASSREVLDGLGAVKVRIMSRIARTS